MGYSKSGKGAKEAKGKGKGKGKAASSKGSGKGKKEQWVSKAGGVKTLIGKEKCTIKLAIDGDVKDVEVDPVTSLSDYLRHTGKTCTKVGCGEGGCGACTVMVAQWGAGESQPMYKTVNACLVSLASCDGMAVITADGLGNSRKGFHPIQERLAENNGSQCGFCSPGMVMSMYGWLKKTNNQPKKEDSEKCLDGNLCRCTGYRAILKAYQTLVDKKVDLSKTDLPFPDALKGYTPRPLFFAGSGKEWYAPVRLPDVFTVLKEIPNNQKVQLTAGNTSRGIYKTDDQVDVFVDINGIPELNAVKADDNGISFGGATTIAKFIDTLEEYFKKKGEKGAPGFPAICEHAKKIAGNQVRNVGTIAGNLMITKSLGFQSDLATILSGAGAEIVLANDRGEEKKLLLSEFLTPSFPKPPAKSSLLQSVIVPFSAGEIVKSFKVAKRSQNAHAIVNASFRVKKNGDTIEDVTMFFGALVSSPSGPVGPFHATKTEEALKGQPITQKTFQNALNTLATEPWWPQDEYEQMLSKSYLCKLFTALTGKDRSDVNVKATLSDIRPVASYGEQNINWGIDENFSPISKPMTKSNAKEQCSGEAQYTGDIPEPRDCLYGAYVLINLPNVKVTKVDASAALKMPGVVAIVDKSDVPGENLGDGESQKIFYGVGDTTDCAGQPAAMILADTQKHAEMAAKKVKVTTTKSDSPLLLTTEACMKIDGKNKTLNTATRGDADKALKEAKHTVKGSAFCNAPRHFYMEPHVHMALPEGGNKMVCYGSVQVATSLQSHVAKVLGVPRTNVIAHSPLVGGGFGGKDSRGMHVASAAAVAARKMNRAVKFVLNRNVDTVMCGGRHPCSTDYEVGFNPDGKITALKVKTLADAGFNLDAGITDFTCMVLNRAIEQAYGIPNLDTSATACLTNKPSATAMRGPGEIQASFFVETVLEHIAAELKMDPQAVREVNIFQDKAEQAAVTKDPLKDAGIQKALVKDIQGDDLVDHPLPGIWEHLKKTANHAAMVKEVEDFNKKNTWRKRGIAMTPVRYHVGQRKQMALMCVYGDGTVKLSVDGTELGQGLWTKVQQFASHYLSKICNTPVPMESITVSPNSTEKVSCGSITGGSTTSEGCALAVQHCCEQLAEQLKPYMEKAGEKKEEITFAKMCEKAGDAFGGTVMTFAGMNKFNPGFCYYVYGACVSMVEIDVLTGETSTLSSKLCYDCGKSLNPLIDAGQCEGAFMQGLGFFLMEELIEDAKTGELLSDGTWEYKIPCAQDVPLQFDVEFMPRPFGHENAVISSKCSGEPPLVLATSVFMAVRYAIAAARKEQGMEGYFRLDAPATARAIAMLCNPKVENFKL